MPRGPRDAPPEFGVPVNPDTGFPLTEAARYHSKMIREAEKALLDALHNAEGSAVTNDYDFQTEGMRRAAAWLKMAVLVALDEVRNR